MRFTARKVQYACAALFELAMEYPRGQPLQVHTMAARQQVPTNYLVQILIALRRAELVVSVRGAQGGYRLAVPPHKITLAEVIHIIDGPLCPTPDTSAGTDSRLAVYWLTKLELAACATVERQFEAITLASIVERYGAQRDPMYYI